jgi:hypothetical protein
MGQAVSPRSASGPVVELDAVAIAFAKLLLEALGVMAARSRRGEADLAAVLRRSGLSADVALVRQALGMLQRNGCVSNVVPLSDGGLLLRVTGLAIDDWHTASHWTAPDDQESHRIA